MSTLAIILSSAAIFGFSYLLMKPNFVAWNVPDRGFTIFYKQWEKLFFLAWLGGTMLGVGLHLFAHTNTGTSLLISVMAGLLGLAAHTDILVGRIPAELSILTTQIGITLGLTVLAFNANEGIRHYSNLYFPPNSDQTLIWIGGGVAIFLLGFLGWLKFNNIIGMLSICVGSVGLFVSIMVTLNWLSNIIGDPFWTAVLYSVTSIFAFLLLTFAFDLGAGNMLGGADSRALYAISWAFGGLVGPYNLALGLLIACVLQMVVHAFAGRLQLGYEKEINRSNLSLGWLRLTHKVFKTKTVPTATKTVRAVPFLPALVVSIIAVVLYTLITQ